MSEPSQAEQEEHFREVERTMLNIAGAAKRAAQAAEDLRKDGAEDHLVAALETAAGALRAEHKRLLQTAYYRVPEQPDDQEKLAV